MRFVAIAVAPLAAILVILPRPAPGAEIEVINRTPIVSTRDAPFRIEASGWGLTFAGGVSAKTSKGDDLVEAYIFFTFLAEDGSVLRVEENAGWLSPGPVRKNIAAASEFPGGLTMVHHVVLTVKPAHIRTKQSIALEARQQAEAVRTETEKREALRRAETEKREALRRTKIESKRWPPDIERAVIERRLLIGMTSEQVELVVGRPLSIQETRKASGVSEQWAFGPGNSLYFENGKLVTIQTTR
jgi:hypothetical protein